MRRDFRTFLEEALGEIARSEPNADAALRAALAGLRARIDDGAGGFVLQAQASGWRFGERSEEADIDVGFDEAAILDLIEGALTLNEAIFRERVVVFGDVDKIGEFYDALLLFLEGLLRARGAPALLERFRNA
jgi:SCP-2 sterol transfer family